MIGYIYIIIQDNSGFHFRLLSIIFLRFLLTLTVWSITDCGERNTAAVYSPVR